MSSINPFIDELQQHHKPLTQPLVTKPLVIQHKPQIRATRSDKLHNIKFPIDENLRLELKRLKKVCAPAYYRKYSEKLEQTKFNSLLLSRGLNTQKDHIDWKQSYKDSGRYMHVVINEIDYNEIGGGYGIAILKDISERRAVYCIMKAMIRWVKNGGSLEEIL
ncbi:hypothetical protein [Peribacillus loiseleuriae]|uniref:hypothetical protein n=1 Tax=Peribacillus loiseleuriae TaxID=1679170 RepID=UPI003D06604E